MGAAAVEVVEVEVEVVWNAFRARELCSTTAATAITAGDDALTRVLKYLWCGFHRCKTR